MIIKLELSPQNFHYDVLYPLYSGPVHSLDYYIFYCLFLISFRNTNNDVCLLKLDGPLDLSNSTESAVAPITLNTNADIELGPKFVVSGWGTTSVSF